MPLGSIADITRSRSLPIVIVMMIMIMIMIMMIMIMMMIMIIIVPKLFEPAYQSTAPFRDVRQSRDCKIS